MKYFLDNVIWLFNNENGDVYKSNELFDFDFCAIFVVSVGCDDSPTESCSRETGLDFYVDAETMILHAL